MSSTAFICSSVSSIVSAAAMSEFIAPSRTLSAREAGHFSRKTAGLARLTGSLRQHPTALRLGSGKLRRHAMSFCVHHSD